MNLHFKSTFSMLVASSLFLSCSAAIVKSQEGDGSECKVIGVGQVQCGTNGTTNTQVFSPGSRIIKPQEPLGFQREPEEEISSQLGAMATARAMSQSGDALAFSFRESVPRSPKVFFDAFGVWEDQEATDREVASETDRKGGIFGFEWAYSDHSLLAALEWADEESDFDGGSTEREEFALSMSGTFDIGEGYYAFGGARYSVIEVSTKRETHFIEGGYVDEIMNARGDTDGRAYSLLAGVGRTVWLESGWRVGASASLNYQREEIDGFQEKFVSTGANSFSFEEQERESLLSSIDVEVVRPFLMDRMVLAPWGRITYLHEFLDGSRDIDVTGSENVTSGLGDSSLTLRTNDPDRDYFSLGAGIELLPQSGSWSASVSYNTLAGHDFLDQHMLATLIRFSF